jgi:phosphatidylserine/phosphatidylglycerophosphate/cardiolipin synthase-like enzyme
LFAPEHAPELEIMKQMLKGRSEVFFAIFTFAGSSGIDDTMPALARAGMTATGVIERGQGAQKWAAARELGNHPNINLYQSTKASGVRKLHHKPMVIDERIVVAGSSTNTLPVNDYNDESIFVLGSVDPVSHGVTVSASESETFAVYMKKEIPRIINDLSEPHTA